MITYADIKISNYEIGLTRLIGKQIKEIKGYLSMEFGKPSFKITEVVLEDDSLMGVEGEHDFPYLTVYNKLYPQPNTDTETLERLYHEQDED